MKDFSRRAIIELRQTLSQIIPRFSAQETPHIILAQRPLRLPSEVSLKRQPAPGLRLDGKHKSNLFLAEYRNEAVHAIRFPYFCFVLEGEIDMRLGIPNRQGKLRDVVNNYDVLTLPTHTALLMPPGVFFPIGTYAHWERPGIPPFPSRMLWIQVSPNGVFCHISSIKEGKHASNNRDTFVPDTQLVVLTEMLMDELRSTEKSANAAAQHALALLLLRVQRGLHDGAQAAAGQVWEQQELFQTDTKNASKSDVTERACHYMQRHIQESYTLEDVANYAYVSPSYLKRLFRADLKTSVMEYALKERLKAAHSMLINTELSVQEIAHYVGYSQAPQFNRIFKRIYSVTPTQFRRDQRNQHKLANKAKK